MNFVIKSVSVLLLGSAAVQADATQVSAGAATADIAKRFFPANSAEINAFTALDQLAGKTGQAVRITEIRLDAADTAITGTAVTDNPQTAPRSCRLTMGSGNLSITAPTCQAALNELRETPGSHAVHQQ